MQIEFGSQKVDLFQNVAKGSDDDIVVVRAYLSDNMEQSGGIVSEDAVWKFMKELLGRPVEYEARIEGTPIHFSGVIFEELDRDIHLIDEFHTPKYWSFYESIDPAEGKPVAWGFFAVSPSEFELTERRIVNRVYWIDYLKLEGMSISDICHTVRRKRADIGYSKPIWAVLDRKYGIRTVKIGEEDTNWHSELRKHDPGVNFVLSSSKPGSIEVGEAITKEYLKKKYNNLTSKEEPTLQIFKKCEHPSDPFCPVTHLWNYSRDEDRPSKRSEEYKDWPDVLRYFLEKYPRYWDVESHKELPKKKTYFKR